MVAEAGSSVASATRIWVVRERPVIAVRQPAQLLGIINATPDSFSDGGMLLDPAAAIAAGERLVREGAAWLDVGGESSRPGAAPVGADEELRRVVPVIAGLRARGVAVPISIDTTKAVVARAALAAGATAINDISAGTDAAMFTLAAEQGCPLVLMHMQGTPATMQRAPRYDDVVGEVAGFLAARIAAAVAAGVDEHALLVDPGIGFGKSLAHNLALLRALPRLGSELGRPLVVGISRKSLVATLVREATGVELAADQRDAASHVLHGLLAGDCALLRVHDVAGARAACALAAAVAVPDRVGHAG
jgi:dihydropteroate synthase